MTRPTPYARLIFALAPDHDPRHIEAYMRVEFGTLDHLDQERFRKEVEIAAMCVDAAGIEQAEACAKSYGM
jgi:hypothetical protein